MTAPNSPKTERRRGSSVAVYEGLVVRIKVGEGSSRGGLIYPREALTVIQVSNVQLDALGVISTLTLDIGVAVAFSGLFVAGGGT